MKTIDPTEILVEGASPKSAADNPWVRFFARLFDYSFICMCIWGLRHFFPFGPYEHWIPFELLLWVPIEALLLSTWGTTPGKWLLKVKITPHLGFEAAIKRSLSVWIRGMGLGIPFVNFFCLLIAYQRLRLLKTTSWDIDSRTKITYGTISRLQFGVVAGFAIFGLLFYTSVR